MSNYSDFMIDFDCPECGGAADERGCENGCDIEDALNAGFYASMPEDAAMESSLFGDC